MNALKAFEAVSRHLSMTAAAKELRVSHGAVSQQMKNLESYLGCALLERTGNAVKLSSQGTQFAQVVQKALAEIASATAAMQHEAERTQLRVSAPPTFAVKWLIPNLPRFHSETANIDVSVDVNSNVVRLGAGGPDAAIRFGTHRDENLIYSELYRPEILIVASPDYLTRRGYLRSLDALDRHNLIQCIPPSGIHTELHLQWHNLSPTAPPAYLEVPEEHMALSAAMQGKGLVLMEDIYVTQELESGLLVKAHDASFAARATYRFVTTAAQDKDVALETLSGWLSDRLRG